IRPSYGGSYRARPTGKKTQYPSTSRIGAAVVEPWCSNQYPVASAATAAARNSQFLGPKCSRERARPWSDIRAGVYAAMSMSSSSWLVVLGQRPPLVEQRPPGPVAPAPQPDQPDQHEPERRPEQPDGAGPAEPAVARRDVALPPGFEVALEHMVGVTQCRVERRVTRQVIDEGFQPVPTPPPLEQQHRGGGERVGGGRVRPVATERPVQLVQIELHAARHLPVQPQGVEAVPLARRHGRVPLLEPERQRPAHARAQRQVSELVSEGGGQSDSRTVGQQHDRAAVRERRTLAPARQAAARKRVERRAGGSENDADGTIG